MDLEEQIRRAQAFSAGIPPILIVQEREGGRYVYIWRFDRGERPKDAQPAIRDLTNHRRARRMLAPQRLFDLPGSVNHFKTPPSLIRPVWGSPGMLVPFKTFSTAVKAARTDQPYPAPWIPPELADVRVLGAWRPERWLPLCLDLEVVGGARSGRRWVQEIHRYGDAEKWFWRAVGMRTPPDDCEAGSLDALRGQVLRVRLGAQMSRWFPRLDFGFLGDA